MEGYIKMHRCILDSEVFRTKDHLLLKMFIYCLGSANYKDLRFEGMTIPAGSFVTSREKLAERLNCSQQEVRTRLAKLEKWGNINLQTNQRFTIITISNWALYQQFDGDTNQLSNQQLTNDQPATNQQSTSNQPATNQQSTSNQPQVKKDKNIKKVIREEGKEGKENASTSVEAIRQNSKSLEERISEFKVKTMQAAKEGDDIEMLEGFIAYWTEHAEGARKGKWEIGKNAATFSIPGRLATWRRNDVEHGHKAKREEAKRREALAQATEQPTLEGLRDFFYEKARGKMDAKQAGELAKKFSDHYSAANWMDGAGRPIVWKQKGLSWLEKELEGGKTSAPGKGVATYYEQRIQEMAEQREKRKKEQEEVERKIAKNKGILRETMQSIMGDQWSVPENQGFIEWYFDACTKIGSTGELVFMEAGITTEEKVRSHMKANWQVYRSHEAQKSKTQAQ